MTDDLRAEIAGILGCMDFWLQVWDIGWSPGHKAWTFPMRKPDGTVTGIRLRTRDGSKFAVKGSKEGLFMPEVIDISPPAERILIAEGPSDTMKLWELGFIAIGRPSCTGAQAYCSEFVSGSDAVIVSDADSPGRKGANRLAEQLVKVCPSVKIIEPLKGNDVRDWVDQGATKDTIDCVINAAYEMSNGTQVQSQSA